MKKLNVDSDSDSDDSRTADSNPVERELIIDSFSHEDIAYRVRVIDNEPVECSCPHYQYRLADDPLAECKHMARASIVL